MKFKLLSFACLAFVTSSCFQNEKSGKLQDSLQRTLAEQEREEKIVEYDPVRDSIRLKESLEVALATANKNIDRDTFQFKYESFLDSGSVSVVIDRGNHFSDKDAHLIIRRSSPATNWIDIYRKKGIEFERVLSHEQWGLTYLNGTIRDVNGDGLNDFVVNWYPMSGCCLKAHSVVYLLRADKSFSNGFEFINPTFSPTEGIIRGICYGHPGETEMYKYKWRGEKVDTVEYVFYEEDKDGPKTGKVLISDKSRNGKILKRLKSVPKEYKTIYGYDWFTGDI